MHSTSLQIGAILPHCLSFLLFVAAAYAESPVAEGSGHPKLKSIAFEGGSVYEVRYTSGTEPTIQLFRFHQSGKFDLMDALGVFLLDGADWKKEDNSFRVTAATNLDWYAEGSFSEKGLQGVVRTAHLNRKFVGQRIDYGSYEFPLQEGEVIVLLRMKRYHPWPLPKGRELADAGVPPDESPAAISVYGFEFEVLAPRELKGMLVTAHHDGYLASGHATAIATPGKTYLWRTERTNIGGREFGICSIDLHWMKATDHLTPDPRYRPGLALLQALGPAPKSGRPGAEPYGPTNGTQPIGSESNQTSSAAGSRR